MKEIYQHYKSTETVELSWKEVYEDSDGYPNKKAFDDFSKKIYENGREYFLICLTVDLSKANRKNYAYGSYILRKFIIALKKVKNCYPFRIQGEKFNVFVGQENLNELKILLDTPDENYDIYYGISEKEYVPDDSEKQIQTCVQMMYMDKSKKRSQDDKSDKIIGNKGNTPVEDRETDTCKNRKTMWYAVVSAVVYEPVYKNVKIHIFPTQYCEPMASIPLVVVSDDMLNCRCFYGKNIQFGVGKVRFTINAHFDNDGSLKPSVFNINSGKCDLQVDTFEGDCIPANFGKRFGNGEIYPFRQNIAGYCDFVYLENGIAALNTTGIIADENNLPYSVHMDSQYINLMPIEKGE